MRTWAISISSQSDMVTRQRCSSLFDCLLSVVRDIGTVRRSGCGRGLRSTDGVQHREGTVTWLESLVGNVVVCVEWSTRGFRFHVNIFYLVIIRFFFPSIAKLKFK